MKKILFYFLPFLFFIIGYYSLSWIAYVSKVSMPSVVGLSLTDAMLQFSSAQLNVRILAMKEEAESEPGIIVQQIPAAGSLIKPNQRVFIVLSKQLEKARAPQLVGLSLDEARLIAKKQGIQVKVHALMSMIYPKHSVIAQWPNKNALLEEKVVHLYVCNSEEMIMIFPNFSGHPVSAVQDFCARNGIGLEIVYATTRDERSAYEQCVVKNQRPLAGSLIDLNKAVQMQISIEKL